MQADKQAHLQQVLCRARKVMERDNIAALVVTVCDNFYYITGFASFFMYTFRHTGAAVAVLFRDPNRSTVVIMNEFEAAGIKFELPNVELRTFPVWVDVDDPLQLHPTAGYRERPTAPPVEMVFTQLKEILSDAGVLDQRIAIELNAMSNGGRQLLLQIAPELDLIDSTYLFNEIRMIKSPWEIALLRKSAQITEKGIQAAAEKIYSGCTAEELTAIYKAVVMQEPDSNISRFHLISVGENFAPRLQPDQDKAKVGDLIKFDCGMDVAGYGADIARTFVLGDASPLVQRIYDVIRHGHEHMLSLVAPGVKLKEVFDSTMAEIKAAGLPNYNRGHLGHGNGVFLGLEEAPFVSHQATEVFLPGMVLSLETPYYGYGVGAIMIEDMLLITDDGIEFFSHLPRELISIPV